MSKPGSSFSFHVGKDNYLYSDAETREGYKFPSDKKILALDLDETLIHSSKTEFKSPDYLIKFTIEGEKVSLYVSKRPNLVLFLRTMAKHYTIVVFTVGVKQYAEVILRSLKIDEYVSHLYHRGNCLKTTEGDYMKDLSTLKVAMNRVILIDDSRKNILLQPKNCLIIPAFNGDKQDRELTKLIPFLVDLADVDDVRHVGERYSQYTENKALLNQSNDPVSEFKKRAVSFIEFKTTPQFPEADLYEDYDSQQLDEESDRKLLPRVCNPLKQGRAKTYLIR